MSTSSATPMEFQSSEMVSREQLLNLFSRFSFLVSQPDVKKRIVDAVREKQNGISLFVLKRTSEEAVAATTAIQEEVFLEMGIDPRFGIACLGKVHAMYENDMDLMIHFYRFVAKEEMTIEEAELEPNVFLEKMHHQDKLQEQQLEMLKNMRKFHPDDQSAILEKLHRQMESANFENSAGFLTLDQIQEIARQRTAPLSRP